MTPDWLRLDVLLLLFDGILLVTMLGLALAAVTSPEPRRAAMLFIAFGFWLALVWARLRAPDVALAEAAIGAGLGGALMLAAARRAARPRADGSTPPTDGEQRSHPRPVGTADDGTDRSPDPAAAQDAWGLRLSSLRAQDPSER